MKQLFLIFAFFIFCNTIFAQKVFINEIRYKGDQNKRGVEIAGPAGTDLSHYLLRFYDADHASIYHTEDLSGTIPNQSNGYGSVWFPVGSYQESDDRGVELYDMNKSGAPEHTIYYGPGPVPTINGQTPDYLGTGIVQTNVGILPQLTPQLIGVGTEASHFTWILQAPTISGIVQGNGIINLNQLFTLLPVQLTGFKVTATTQNIQLSWRTASELNNSYFEIERSEDGEIFESIGKVKGEGTTQNLQTYQHIDKPSKSGTYYYRLKQVDKDGTFEYSNVVSTELEVQLKVEIMPNPVRNNGALTIKASGDEALKATLYNATGQLIREWNINGDTQLDVAGIQPGVYFCLLRKAGTIIERRQILIIK